MTKIKNFFIASLIIHFSFLLIFISLSFDKSEENIKISINNNEETFEIDDITDDEILSRQTFIQSNEEQKLKEINDQVNQKTEELNNIEKELLNKKNKSTQKIVDQKKIISENEKLMDKLRKEKELIENEKNKLAKEKLEIEKAKDKALKELNNIKKKPTIKNESKTQNINDTEHKKILSKYIEKISFNFQKNWIIPLNVEKSWRCTVILKQDESGSIKNLTINKNCPNDPDFINSIKNAVRMSFPLEKAPKELNFKDLEEITLEFKVNF